MTSKITQPINIFRWRPKQRRMVTDVWKNCTAESFIVLGKTMQIQFEYQTTGPDPGSKVGKMARIYKPNVISTPKELMDITLYVRV